MTQQGILFDKVIDPADVVYTPTDVAKGIIRHLSPIGLCLDPCKGDGAFYDHLPTNSEYCELREGKDFFDFNRQVDWVIGNPPYSIFKEFMEHGFDIATNVSYLVPTNKVFQRQVIMEAINGGGYAV